MFVLFFFAFVGFGCVRAQLPVIDVDAEYPDPAFSTAGSSVTLLAPGPSLNEARFYGAIVVGSADQTTTYHLVPTILIRDTPVFDPLVSTMIVGPETVIQSYSVQDMDMTIHSSCSVSGTKLAVCTSTLEGGQKSVPAKTTTIQDPRFETYQVVTRTEASTNSSQATETPTMTSPETQTTTQMSNQASGEPVSTNAAGKAQAIAGLGWVGIMPMLLAFL